MRDAATERMSGTLPFGNDVNPPRLSSEPPEPPMNFPFKRGKGGGNHALSGTAKAVLAIAAIWLGLAFLISASAYAMAWPAHITLVVAGLWLTAAGLAYVLAMPRPVTA